MAGKRILFITWDGPQTSYLESLFLPIFAALQAQGDTFHVLQFTWGDHAKSNRAAAACAEAGVPYRRVDIERRLGRAGAFVSAARGGRHVDRAVRDWAIDTLMPRSLMPALAVLRSNSLRVCATIFDADGLAADERVDFAALSANSPTYRVLRDIEAQIVRRADAVLVRTKATIPILWARAGAGTSLEKFFVVSNGKDSDLFAPAAGMEAAAGGPSLCYIGSLGAQYQPGLMLAIAAYLRRQSVGLRFDVFTLDRAAFDAAMTEAGLSGADWISVRSLAPSEVPAVLPAYDAGFALRTRSFSMQGVSPIKIGEYLLAGVPLIGTAGIGDVDELIEDGLMIAAKEDNIGPIGDWMTTHVLPNRVTIAEHCRAAGMRSYSLPSSVKLYAEAMSWVDARRGA